MQQMARPLRIRYLGPTPELATNALIIDEDGHFVYQRQRAGGLGHGQL
jgi:hypothetical protein